MKHHYVSGTPAGVIVQQRISLQVLQWPRCPVFFPPILFLLLVLLLHCLSCIITPAGSGRPKRIQFLLSGEGVVVPPETKCLLCEGRGVFLQVQRYFLLPFALLPLVVGSPRPFQDRSGPIKRAATTLAAHCSGGELCRQECGDSHRASVSDMSCSGSIIGNRCLINGVGSWG